MKQSIITIEEVLGLKIFQIQRMKEYFIEKGEDPSKWVEEEHTSLLYEDIIKVNWGCYRLLKKGDE